MFVLHLCPNHIGCKQISPFYFRVGIKRMMLARISPQGLQIEKFTQVYAHKMTMYVYLNLSLHKQVKLLIKLQVEQVIFVESL